MTELEEQIVNLIVQRTGIKAKKVNLNSRLAQDIGMDGDDAVEFFEKFTEQFHVDLTALGPNWQRHFLPEGGGPSLGCMVTIGIGVVAGGLLHEAFKRVPAWAAMIVLVPLFCRIYVKLFDEPEDEMIPITVKDLVDAAIAGTWVKSYGEQENRQP